MEIEYIIPGPNKYNKNVYEFSPIEERNEIYYMVKKKFSNILKIS